MKRKYLFCIFVPEQKHSHMKISRIFFPAMLTLCCSLLLNSCKKEEDEPPPAPPVAPVTCTPSTSHTPGTGPNLIFKFVFDSTQVRLNNVGSPSTVPAGNAAQSPVFNKISQHYIELAGDWDAVGSGTVLYTGTTTTTGGASAIDYCASTQTGQGEIFFSKPLSSITPGSYKWLRVSLAYQNYDITYKASSIGVGTGTIASFIGFRSYITGYKINGRDYVPSSGAGGQGNHDQGYWGFETTVLGTHYFLDGQAPAGATTVPNPLFASSPIPSGSCLVTGQFVDNTMANSPLVITGLETSDIVITVSLSTNKSFEWHEVTSDNYYQPEIGEYVVDMGIRGLIPIRN
jgi:hypothetical protein